MAKRGKKYKKVKSQVEPGKIHELGDAIAFMKANPMAKFDETVDIAVKLGLDPAKTEQSVRGTVRLPNGSGKKVRVIVFAAGAAADEATKAGADHVGFEDLVEKVKGGWLDFDVAIATTDAMKEVRKLGKVLGPRGLMPNPKTGTVSDDTAAAVKQYKAGMVEFRMDKQANVHVPFGKLSFEAPKLLENAQAVIDAIRAARPAAAKGVFIKRFGVSSTMGVGLRVNITD
jgi:large subunit ribosomal protein L1